jgi:hypothetical protein
MTEKIYSTLLYDLGNERYVVDKPIPITIRCDERRDPYEGYITDEFLVEWIEMGISAYGATADVAIYEFRKEVMKAYDRFVDTDKVDISIPSFRILRKCIAKI